MLKRWLVILLLSFLAIRAQATPTISVRPVLTRDFVPGKWQPVAVSITNGANDGAINGEIRIAMIESYSKAVLRVFTRPISVPGGAGTTTVSLLIALSDYQATEITTYLVDGQDGKGQALAKNTNPQRQMSLDQFDPILLAVSPQPDALRYLDRERFGVGTHLRVLRPFRPLPKSKQSPQPLPEPGIRVSSLTSPNDLPDNMAGYDAISVLYIGAETRPDGFSDAQITALQNWLRQGGYLILGREPGKAPALSGDERFRSWLPTVNPADNRSEIGVVTPFGQGHIRVLGRDLVTVTSSKAYRSVWRQIFATGTAPPSVAALSTGQLVYSDSIIDAPLVAPGNVAPEVSSVGIVLLVYVLLVVPVNYLVLKRLGRREWAWATIPAMVVLFSLSAYGFGFSTKGTRLYMNSASVIEMNENQGETTLVGSVGLFSPFRSQYRIDLRMPDALFWNRGYREVDGGVTTQVQDGQKAALRDFDVSMWAMRSIGVRTGALTLGKGIEAHLRTLGSPSAWRSVEGTITNRTGKTLHNVVVTRKEIGQAIPTLLPNQTLKIHIDRAHPLGVLPYGVGINQPKQRNPKGLSAQALAEVMRQQMRSRIIASIPSEGNQRGSNEWVMARDADAITLYGWIDEPLLPLSVDGKTQVDGYHTNLLVAHLNAPR